MSVPHRRRLGKLFVSGQLRETFGRGYGPLGSPGRGRGGRRPGARRRRGAPDLSEEGQGDNTAYTGRLGR